MQTNFWDMDDGKTTKTSQCIELLKILYSRNSIVGVAELAGELDTNPRNIPLYVKELRRIGYQIKTEHGRYGGYYLERHGLFPVTKLSDEERTGLMAGTEYLLARNDFMEKKAFFAAMRKVMPSVMTRDTGLDEPFVANRFPLAMSEEELESRYLALQKAIAERYVVEIDYLSQQNDRTKRMIHPYKLYMYNNAWFVLAFDESIRDIRYFKINRIQNWAVQHRTFRVLKTYQESDYLDEFGMKQNGNWYPIKLRLTGNYAMLVTERVYGKDQRVEKIDDRTTELSVKMQNKDSVLRFVLGFGKDCEVLEPTWLKDELMKVVAQYRNLYDEPKE